MFPPVITMKGLTVLQKKGIIVKNDYATATELGMTSSGNVEKKSNYDGPTENQPSGNVDGFYWSGSNSIKKNTWSLSTLNTTGLNTNYIGNFTSAWQNKIANVVWKVGGNVNDNLIGETPIFETYYWEISRSGIPPVGYNHDEVVIPEDAKTEIPNKIGLMYISDYGYASPQNLWSLGLDYDLQEYEDIRVVDWLYKGVYEWLITRTYNSNKRAFYIFKNGEVGFDVIYSQINAVRPTFYLTEDTEIDMINYAGTLADPYRIVLN